MVRIVFLTCPRAWALSHWFDRNAQHCGPYARHCTHREFSIGQVSDWDQLLREKPTYIITLEQDLSQARGATSPRLNHVPADV